MEVELLPIKRVENIMIVFFSHILKIFCASLSVFYLYLYPFFILLFCDVFSMVLFASESTAFVSSAFENAETWATKTNARWTLLSTTEHRSQTDSQDPIQRTVLFESDFGTERFTWLQWIPSNSKDASTSDCLRFQITGDGSGHQLFVRLLVPDGPRFRYYDNQIQSIRLDFCDRREMILDLDQFVAPSQSDRTSDLAHIAKIEFVVRVCGVVKPIHVAISAPRWSRWTETEMLDKQRVKQDREELASKLRPSVQALRKLAENRRFGKFSQFQKNADDGKYRKDGNGNISGDVCVDSIDCVNWKDFQAAVNLWCVDDLERSLEDDDLESLRYVERHKIPELMARLNSPSLFYKKQIKKRLDWKNNPFVHHPIMAVHRDFIDSPPSPEYPRSFPRGERGFRSVAEPWDFRRFAEESVVLTWCVTRADSPLEDQPKLVEPLLSRLELLATQHRNGDYGAGRTSMRGYDPNGNRFALAAVLEAWNTWERSYPDLLPQAWRDEWNAGFNTLVQYQVDEYGIGRIEQIAQKPLSQCVNKDFMRICYANMDALYLRIMDLAIRLWPDHENSRRWSEERRIFQKILDASLLPDGGIRYLGDENDCPQYHQVVILAVAAIVRDAQWDVSFVDRQNDVTFSWIKSCDFPERWERRFLRRTLPYYPLAFEPSGLSEYTTAPDWKRYWSRGDAAAPAILAGLFDNVDNQAVATHCAEVWGYGKGYYAITAADFWKPIAPQPIENSRVTFDHNIGGLRGRHGNWSWVAGKRIPENGQSQEWIKYLYGSSKAASHPFPIGIEYQFQSTESAESRVSLPNVVPLAVPHTPLAITPFRVGVLLSQPGKTPLPLDAVAEVEVTPSFATDSLCQRWIFDKTTAIGTILIQPKTCYSPSDKSHVEPTASTNSENTQTMIRLGFNHELIAIAPNAWLYGGLRIRILPLVPTNFQEVFSENDSQNDGQKGNYDHNYGYKDNYQEKEWQEENQEQGNDRVQPRQTALPQDDITIRELPWRLTTRTVSTWAKNRSVGEATEISIQQSKERPNAPLYFVILIDMVDEIH